MREKQNNKNFWNRYAKIYDFEIDRFNRSACSEMYRLISGALTKEMDMLEIATGTGLIAVNIADCRNMYSLWLSIAKNSRGNND